MTIESDLSAIRATLEEINMNFKIGLGLLQSGGGGAALGTDAIEAAVSASTSTAFFMDTATADNMYQDLAGTTPVTASGQNVLHYKTGGFNLVAVLDTRHPTWVSSEKALLFTEANTDALRKQTNTFSADMYAAAIVKTTDTAWCVMGGGEQFHYLFGTSTGSFACNGCGSTYEVFVDGSSIGVNPTVATFLAATNDGNKHLVEATGLDMTASFFATEFRVGTGHSSATNLMDGYIGDLVVCDNPGASSRASIRAELAARHGITL